MLDRVIGSVCSELNQYIKSQSQLSEDLVVMSGIVGQSGEIAVEGKNKIVCTLVHVEPENTFRNAFDPTKGGISKAKVPLSFNLHLLFSACFDNRSYSEALEMLSLVLQFFNSKPVFTSSNSILPLKEAKLSIELATLSYQEVSELWSGLGAKMMPFLMYKMHCLVIENDRIDTVPSEV